MTLTPLSEYSSGISSTIASGLGTHLWQSTLFAAAAGLLTLTLRKNHAQARYGLWLAASVKFLIPFLLLVAIGNRLAWSAGSAITNHRLHFAIEVISAAAPATAVPALLLPAMIGVWLCGFLAVPFLWCVQWRKMSAVVRAATPLREGREVEALRRMEMISGMRKQIEMRLSRTPIEPGIFGIFRPVLMWPEGISGRLEDAQLDAILAHEVQHVRRHDNLAAAIHMGVEAIFWFHPLVWWLGARLVEERERACDEEVLELGSERQIYAEGILKVCEFCLASPLACISGVAGGDLKKRMVHIMTERILQKLDFGRKLVLGAAGLAAAATPIVFGLATATHAVSPAASAVAQQSEQPAAAHASVHASKEEMNALVLKRIPPEYPQAAKKAHIQGQVILRAIISKDGDVENLQIVSGHPQLAPAAIEAVKQWKYRPYLQQGIPVEVETEITVNFTLVK
jgi:TonB family protein